MRGVVAALMLLAAGTVAAQGEREVERRLAVRLGVSSSDNLGRNAPGLLGDSETFGTVGVDFGVSRETRRFDAFVDSGLDYYRYDSDRFENETLGRMSAGLTIRVVPSIFTWDFAEQLTHMRRDPFRTAGPGNRERLNSFSTGPTITTPLSGRYVMRFSARHTDRQWDESRQLDSAAQSADLSILRDIGARQRVGLSVGERRVKYDLPMIPRFNAQLAYLTYARRSQDSSFSLSAGTNRLKFLEEAETRPYFSADWTYRVAPRSTLSLSASRQFQDVGSELGGGRLRDFREDADVGDIPLTNAPFEATRYGVTYTLTRPRAEYSISTTRSREEFEGEPLFNRERHLSRAGVSYRFSRATSGNLSLFHRDEQFDAVLRDAVERGATLGVSHQLASDWSMAFRYGYIERRDSLQQDFGENRYTISLVWAPVSMN